MRMFYRLYISFFSAQQILYQHLPSATQWTVRNIVSTLMVHCWLGTKRESFVPAGTPHCRSLQMRTSTTCFRSIYQTINSSVSVLRNRWVTTCGLMLTLSVSTTLATGIGSTAKLQVICRLVIIHISLFRTIHLYWNELWCCDANAVFCYYFSVRSPVCLSVCLSVTLIHCVSVALTSLAWLDS